MGLAERFKNTLNTTNIFDPPNKSIQDLKKTISEPIPAQVKVIPTLGSEKIEEVCKFPELVESTVRKIGQTPYWQDYTEKEQEKMVSKYFNKKIQGEDYAGVKISLKDKLLFIQDVLNAVRKI
jgi:hypothetical protein